jgi:hypothetical protein
VLKEAHLLSCWRNLTRRALDCKLRDAVAIPQTPLQLFAALQCGSALPFSSSVWKLLQFEVAVFDLRRDPLVLLLKCRYLCSTVARRRLLFLC